MNKLEYIKSMNGKIEYVTTEVNGDITIDLDYKKMSVNAKALVEKLEDYMGQKSVITKTEDGYLVLTFTAEEATEVASEEEVEAKTFEIPSAKTCEQYNFNPISENESTTQKEMKEALKVIEKEVLRKHKQFFNSTFEEEYKPTLQEKEKMLDDKIEELSKYILELAIKENRFDINIYYHGNVENFSIWIKRKKGSTLEDYRKDVYLDGVIDFSTRLERKEKTVSILCEMIEEIKRRQSQC